MKGGMNKDCWRPNVFDKFRFAHDKVLYISIKTTVVSIEMGNPLVGLKLWSFCFTVEEHLSSLLLLDLLFEFLGCFDHFEGRRQNHYNPFYDIGCYRLLIVINLFILVKQDKCWRLTEVESV
jgi:hypothetical protein